LLMATHFGSHFSFSRVLVFCLFYADVLILHREASCYILQGVGECLKTHVTRPVCRDPPIGRLRPKQTKPRLKS
jgi:hypothetical protein